MKAAREIYEFITGGSVISVIGLIVALGAALVLNGTAPLIRASVFTSILVVTFIASTYERVQ